MYVVPYKNFQNNKNMKKSLILLLFVLLFSSIKSQVTLVTLTCYQPVKKQCDSQPLITADGSKINLHHLEEDKIQWCAISRDLLPLFPKNKPKKILIKGYGLYEVRDVMHSRHKHRVDILIHPKNDKMVFKTNVKIIILKYDKRRGKQRNFIKNK